MKNALPLLLALTLSSCSWVGMTRVPDNWEAASDFEPSCTSAPWLPLADILVPVGLIGIGGTGGRLAPPPLTSLGIVMLPIGVASALTGLVWAHTCRNAKEEHAAIGSLNRLVPGQRLPQAGMARNAWLEARPREQVPH